MTLSLANCHDVMVWKLIDPGLKICVIHNICVLFTICVLEV